MPLRLKVSGLFLLILLVLLSVSTGVSVFAAGGTAELSAEELQRMADQMTREYFELNWQLGNAAQEKEEISRQLKQLNALQQGGAARLEKLQEQLEQKKKKFSKWLNFVYRHGRMSLFNVVLKAGDFTDFLTARRLAADILNYQGELLTDLLQTKKSMEGQQQAIAISLAEKREKLVQLEQLEKRLAVLTSQKQQSLEAVHQAERQYNLEIEAREQRWAGMVTSLGQLMQAFRNFDWNKLEPDKLQFSIFTGSAVAEFTADNLQEILHNNPEGKDFLVKIDRDGLLLSRKDQDEMQLRAALQVDDNKLVFQPRSIYLAGEELSPEMVRQLVSGYDLSAPLPQVYPGVTAKQIQTEDGAIRVEFGMGKVR